MKAFPKIFALGTDYIRDIFRHDVEVTEKIDGSQFGFGMIDGQLFMRSKGKQLYPEAAEKMFARAIEYVDSIAHRLPPDIMFYAEYLQKPKHNLLVYTRIPQNHLILFGAMDTTERFISSYGSLQGMAELLEIEVVPLVYQGHIEGPEFIRGLLERESVLGGTKIEGVVVKNYEAKFLLGGQPMPLMAGKYVSEAFKEVMKGWSKEHTGPGRWETFKEDYRTPARWAKAVQHLREAGQLLGAPQDIGPLIKEVCRDITEEEIDNIKDFLWKEFGKDVLRNATRGLPEWYKDRLLEGGFDNE